MIDTIEKRESHIQRKIDNEVTNAKKLSAAGKKRDALQCIKRKKMFEQQLDQISCARPLPLALSLSSSLAPGRRHRGRGTSTLTRSGVGLGARVCRGRRAATRR